MCEKPFALDAREAERMRAAADAAGVVHIVGHEFRWAPERALVARAIRDGIIGEPRTFVLAQLVDLVADPAARMPEWWFDAARGGGWLGASGSHVVDQLRTWLGEIASVSAVLTSVATDRGAEDSFVVRVATCGGAQGTVQQSGGAWSEGISLTCIAGTDGTLELAGTTVFCSDRNGRRALDVPDDLALPAIAPSPDPRERYTHLELGPYTQLCNAFRAAIEGRPAGAVAPATFADGVAGMQVIDAIRASAARGGAVVEVG